MRAETANTMKDGELLEAFRTLGDQDAFTALMRRHGQMVHGAARAMVGDAAVAEDVVQATFLALARKGGLLEGADSVAGWLYHVALCLARNEYRAQVRRKAREEEAAMIATEPDSGTFVEGVVSTLYEELGKLAEKYRQPVILHHLEGLSYEAAAPMCGCSEPAFRMRLTRGREQLRERLARRGVALGITALVAGLSQSAASAAELPAALVASTCQAATGVAAGGTVAGGIVSAKVAALTDSALRLLFWAQVKTVAAVCAGIAVLGGTAVTVALTLASSNPHDADNAHITKTLSSPEAVWIRELLDRAKEGPWDKLDFGKCSTRDKDAVWMVNDSSGAGRHFWSMPNQSADILFDTSPWKRGVLTARMMILPEGKTRPEFAPPINAKRMEWASWTTVGDTLENEGPPHGILLAFRYGKRAGEPDTTPGHSGYVSVGELAGSALKRGIWYRCAVYMDMSIEGSSIILHAVWPDDAAVGPEASNWSAHRWDQHLTGLGFMAHQVPMLVQDLKFVPLGPEMPLPPSSLLRQTAAVPRLSDAAARAIHEEFPNATITKVEKREKE